ncbi:DMT family transporter [Thalassotalea atypica]|uniref:DMT family transporter n=1 Tax=Thalassotalea atypica TaxID=2054316 RepID=UPI002573B43F|nr:DMT family transporter [Thalassotalea atypica]
MQTISFTCLAMLAFAANSVLCRIALSESEIDPATFTSIRLASGALTLFLLVSVQQASRKIKNKGTGSWLAAFALFIYAAAFSFAYVNIPTGTGAFILFSTVQLFLLVHALLNGAQLTKWQWFGFMFALIGLLVLLLPGIKAPPILSAVLMMLAGCAWGIYSIKGKAGTDPLGVTADNFTRTLPMVVLLNIVMISQFSIDIKGSVYAILSGVFGSAIGYAIWYTVLPKLQDTSASVVQLSVPVIATIAGVFLLSEAITIQSIVASLTILTGILIVLLSKRE